MRYLVIALGLTLLAILVGLASAAVYLTMGLRAAAAAMSNAIKCPLPHCRTPPSPSLTIPSKPASIWPLDTTASYSYHLALMNFEALLIGASQAGKVVVPPPGINIIEEIATHKYPHLGIVCSRGTSLIVAFRGSQYLDELFEDLDMAQVAFSPPPQSIIGQASGSDVPSFRVHRGFLSVYQSVQQTLLSSLQGKQATSVVFIGHSLGAALAVLGAVSLRLASPSIDVCVITYACPRIGNAAWVDLVDASVPHVRFENASDEVPVFPPSVVPNRSDYNAPYIYLQSGTAIIFQQNWASTLNNHVIDNYLSWLQSYKV